MLISMAFPNNVHFSNNFFNKLIFSEKGYRNRISGHSSPKI